MDGVDRVVRRKTLAERLGLKNIGCCGSSWGHREITVSERDGDAEEYGQLETQIEVTSADHAPPENESTAECIPTASGMNLAAALAAERHLRAALDSDNGGTDPGPSPNPSPVRPDNNEWDDVTAGTGPRSTPFRVSLMKLLEETDGWDAQVKKEEKGGVEDGCGDLVCCVCMGRKKGAAFIPCGHTFCRVCSRELWLNRGNCPLCNRLILEVLDIY